MIYTWIPCVPYTQVSTGMLDYGTVKDQRRNHFRTGVGVGLGSGSVPKTGAPLTRSLSAPELSRSVELERLSSACCRADFTMT